MDDLDTAPDLKPMITGIIRHVQNGTAPTARSFGYANSNSGLTTRSIFRDQAENGWTNFLCGRWGVKWKEGQQRHYLRMKSRKSTRLWVIAILKKLLLLQWDMWQFCNTALHLPTGATATTSHHSLNYKIDKEIRWGTDGIDCSNYCLFSPPNTLTKLQSRSIHNKELWLYEVGLARKEYVEPDNSVTCQAISQRNQKHSFLITDGLFIPILPRKRPIITTQNNRITDEEQHATAVHFLGPPSKRARVFSLFINHLSLYL